MPGDGATDGIITEPVAHLPEDREGEPILGSEQGGQSQIFWGGIIFPKKVVCLNSLFWLPTASNWVCFNRPRSV